MSSYTPGGLLRVALLGNTAGTGYLFARCLRNQGARADLFLASEEEDFIPPFAPNVRPPAGSDWVIRWDPSGMGGAGGLFAKRSEKATLKKLAGEYHLVQAIGATVVVAPSTEKPYVHLALSGDLRGLGLEDSPNGKAYRKALQGAATIFYMQPEQVRILNEISAMKREFLPYPVQVAAARPALRPANPVLRIFHPARVDWAEFERDRLLKSGDRFYRACARFVAEGGQLELVLVDRGRESEATRRIIDKLGLAHATTWLPHLDRMELARQLMEADVVVDDFDAPSLGMIALESMAAGRPVLGYVDLAAYEIAYGDQPPIMCARTETELFASICQACDPNFREQLAAAAHYWVWTHHREDAVGECLIDLYTNRILAQGAI